MIGKLKGTIDSFGDDWAIVDVGGVGYVVHCSAMTLRRLPGKGEPATLAIETYVREDQIRLFGFSDEGERDCFKALLGVQGVGTKVALAILSTMAPGELAQAVAVQDKNVVARSPGVGPKVAQRIVTELKDKLAGAVSFEAAGAATGVTADGVAPGAVFDAVSALTNLGYPHPRAANAVAAAWHEAGEQASAQDLIKAGLKELAR